MSVVRTLCLVWVLAMAPAVALAQPAPEPTPAVATTVATPAQSAQTDAARAQVVAAQRSAQTQTAQRAALAKHYQDQLAAIDSLKHERASWRRDRELRQSLADSADTANQLAKLDQQLAAATQQLAAARRAFATAIDVELAAGAPPDRAGQLARERAALQLGGKPKKIVLPDTTIDQLADPEELEQQAQVITDTEKQLAAQVAALDQQAGELTRVAELRKSADRAKDMMIREDDQPHRDMAHSTSHTTTDSPSSTVGFGGPQGGTGNGQGGAGSTPTTGNDNDPHAAFEAEASFVLGEVIDPSTLDTLARASRSGDPARRAAAARATRDAVAARLDQLRKQRAKIELRERQLRGQ